MQKISIILIALLMMCFSTTIMYGQKKNQKNRIIQELNTDEPGKGSVKIFEDERIQDVLGRSMAPPRQVYTSADGTVKYHRMRGFKIQAFSGNNQRTSRNEAMWKQQLINKEFPEHETVILFESPFWRLRVGNFSERSEAQKVMGDIRRAFPSFGKEMYIVVDEVKIPISEEDDFDSED